MKRGEEERGEEEKRRERKGKGKGEEERREKEEEGGEKEGGEDKVLLILLPLAPSPHHEAGKGRTPGRRTTQRI